jgi:PilZ domain
MAYFPQTDRRVRSPRVRVPQGPKVLFILDNEPIEGVLHKLSLTGGAVEVARECAPGAIAEIRLHTSSGTVQAVVEMLTKNDAKAQEQPFRFVALGDDDQKLLVRAIKNLRKQGFGETVD